jgi:hypothetical protein
MTPIRTLILACLAGALALGGAGALAQPRSDAMDPKRLAGRYDGGQTEMAAFLELQPDGRFRYALSYGALDEQAEGRWEPDGSHVRLTSAPTTPPKFVLLGARPTDAATLEVALDLPPGVSRQYFNARVKLADGRTLEPQFAEGGLEMPLAPGDRPVSIALLLPVFGLEGEPAPLPAGKGAAVRFRFEPNDIGKVAFAREGLAVEPQGLRLQRHDRSILFRRVDEP